jgi:AcrR family transcriptional regulator
VRYKKSDISVAHIVEATTRVLARQGYAHTSLMDIAKEAGMSKGAVHYHFPTKEALMTVVLRNACDAVANRTREVWTEGENPLKALRSSSLKLWRARAELSNEASVVADLLAQSLHDHKLREPLAEYYRFASAQVQEHLQTNLVKVGLKPKLPLPMISRILHAFLDGFLMQHIVDPEAVSEQSLLDAFETLATALFEFAPVEAG